MKTYDSILKKNLTGSYSGYVLSEVSLSLLNIDEVKSYYRKLKKIPYKISYFLKTDNIKEVYKSDCCKHASDEYYLVIDNNNIIYHLSY